MATVLTDVPTRSVSPAPASQVLSRQLHDFDEFSALFGRWDGQFRQISRGAFYGRADRASGQVVHAFRAQTNQAIFTRGMGEASHATFIPITAQNEATVWRGRRLSTGQLIVKGPEAEYCNQTRRNAGITALLVPADTFLYATRTLTGREVGLEMTSWNAVRPSPQTMCRFEQRLARLIATAIRTAGFLDSSEGYELEHECLRALIDALAGPSPDASSTQYHGSPSTLVRRAVEAMDDRVDQPLTAIDLCAALRVSDRVLRRVFKEEYGMGPLAYFRVLRLHRVRTALKSARGREETVADIARRWGFHRLGSFAAEYERQFGELPSKTRGVRGWPGVQKAIGADSGSVHFL